MTKMERPGPDSSLQEVRDYLAAIEPGPNATLQEVSDYLATAAEMGTNVRCPICHLRTHVNSPKYKYFNPRNPRYPRNTRNEKAKGTEEGTEEVSRRP